MSQLNPSCSYLSKLKWKIFSEFLSLDQSFMLFCRCMTVFISGSCDSICIQSSNIVFASWPLLPVWLYLFLVCWEFILYYWAADIRLTLSAALLLGYLVGCHQSFELICFREELVWEYQIEMYQQGWNGYQDFIVISHNTTIVCSSQILDIVLDICPVFLRALCTYVDVTSHPWFSQHLFYSEQVNGLLL